MRPLRALMLAAALALASPIAAPAAQTGAATGDETTRLAPLYALLATAAEAARDTDRDPEDARARAARLDAELRARAGRLAETRMAALQAAPATAGTLIEVRALAAGWQALSEAHAALGLPDLTGVAPLSESPAGRMLAGLDALDRQIADRLIARALAKIDADTLGARMTQAGDLWEQPRPHLERHAPEVLARLHEKLGAFYNEGREAMYERVCRANLARAGMTRRDGPEVVFARDTAPFGWVICKFAWTGMRIDYQPGPEPELTFTVEHPRTNFDGSTLEPFEKVRVRFRRLDNPDHIHDGIYYGRKVWIDGTPRTLDVRGWQELERALADVWIRY